MSAPFNPSRCKALAIAIAIVLPLACALMAAPASSEIAPAPKSERQAERDAMVRTIENHRAGLPEQLAREGFDPLVLQVMREVPRHFFVPDDMAPHAYEDRALPIEQMQTISQPMIVALMTSLLRPQPDHVVLEVGTGSGYQAAVLSPLVRRVYTIEIIPELAKEAASVLARTGYDKNVEIRTGDGYQGWEEAAPFDGIMVTAGADHVPPRLLEQLRPGGRMVIPLGERFGLQELALIERNTDGTLREQRLLPVRFVPLTRDGDAAP